MKWYWKVLLVIWLAPSALYVLGAIQSWFESNFDMGFYYLILYICYLGWVLNSIRSIQVFFEFYNNPRKTKFKYVASILTPYHYWAKKGYLR